ncbi:MAG: NAD(P)H-quinone oxidoreductase [Gemmatimonadota bacterium]
MRAVILPSLEIVDRPAPVAEAGQVVVAVHAAALNRADLLQRVGKYPAPPGWPDDIPCMEYAGSVVACGSGVTRWTVRDKVMGLVGGGAAAEQLVVHESEVLRVPDGMSFHDAAAIPEAFLTAWDALVLRGKAQRGDRVLVHTIGSGVGTAAAQLARLLDLELIGTSRTAEKLARCLPLGMTRGVLTTHPDWPAEVGAPVNVIVDTLGAEALDANIGLLAKRGRLVVLGTLTGGRAAGIDLGVVLRHRLEIIGTAMRVRTLPERAELIARFSVEVLPYFATGVLRPIVESVVPMRDAARGYDLLTSNATFGKVVLAWDR